MPVLGAAAAVAAEKSVSLSSHHRWLSTSTAAHDQTIAQGAFPSLILGADQRVTPMGSFAEAQAAFLDPDPEAVRELAALLVRANAGIVAHYYMDVELQGVLQAVAKDHLAGRVGIADSLRMGDMAVEMVQKQGVTAIACLGVDFMSESVAAILAQNGHGAVPVYRAAQAKIGCSLAESAEQTAYRAWLQQESSQSNAHALHVVYINTSLETKAVSNSLVPTITCTSSNVLQTLLSAAAQMGHDDNFKILYGPDTYMGENLITMLDVLLASEDWDDAKIAADLHPAHTRATLARLRDCIRVFPSGNCVVHHMFGAQVVQTVQQHYPDAYVTAHLEVPGEMFQIAMQQSLSDRGVVGSTSDILKFIARKVQEAAETSNRNNQSSTGNSSSSTPQRLQFILGTEAGMVTSIVSSVQAILAATGNTDVEAEIIFPVASEAVMATDDDDVHNNTGMALVPGVAGGDGCSTAGGCATCPFMKMNHLDALMDVLEMVGSASSSNDINGTQTQTQLQQLQEQLKKHLPPDRLRGKSIGGRPAIDCGTEPIAYMRAFNQHRKLPDELVQRVMTAEPTAP